MKTLILSLCLIVFIPVSYSQELETLGAGVIDFLLTNPSTANKANATQKAALEVIGNLLNIAAQRKHDINVANAGKSEITINTNNNNQATIYLDAQGNMYLLYNGTIYPISPTLINQAKSDNYKPTNYDLTPTIKNATLPNYDLLSLKDEYKFEKETSYIMSPQLTRNYLYISKLYLNSITSQYNISIDDIYFEPYKINKGNIVYLNYKYTLKDLLGVFEHWITFGKTSERGLGKLGKKLTLQIYNSEKPIIQTPYGCKNFIKNFLAFNFPGYDKFTTFNGFAIYVNAKASIPVTLYASKIVTTFTCNWAKDFDGQGYDVDDFIGIKRSFYKDESLLFVMGYTTESNGTWKFEILNASDGSWIYDKTGSATSGAHTITLEKEGQKLLPGVYIYNFTLTVLGINKFTRSERFEIIER